MKNACRVHVAMRILFLQAIEGVAHARVVNEGGILDGHDANGRQLWRIAQICIISTNFRYYFK